MARIRRKLGKLGWSMVVAAMALWIVLPLASLALDAALYIDGITPETPVDLDGKGTREALAVEAFSWEAEIGFLTDASGGGVRASGASRVGTLKVVRAGPDGASPQLLQKLLTGEVLPSATLRVGAVGPNPDPKGVGNLPGDFWIELTDVIISSVEYSGGLSDPRESVELVGGQVRLVDLSTGNDFDWNVTTNQENP